MKIRIYEVFSGGATPVQYFEPTKVLAMKRKQELHRQNPEVTVWVSEHFIPATKAGIATALNNLPFKR